VNRGFRRPLQVKSVDRRYCARCGSWLRLPTILPKRITWARNRPRAESRLVIVTVMAPPVHRLPLRVGGSIPLGRGVISAVQVGLPFETSLNPSLVPANIPSISSEAISGRKSIQFRFMARRTDRGRDRRHRPTAGRRLYFRSRLQRRSPYHSRCGTGTSPRRDRLLRPQGGCYDARKRGSVGALSFSRMQR